LDEAQQRPFFCGRNLAKGIEVRPVDRPNSIRPACGAMQVRPWAEQWVTAALAVIQAEERPDDGVPTSAELLNDGSKFRCLTSPRRRVGGGPNGGDLPIGSSV